MFASDDGAGARSAVLEEPPPLLDEAAAAVIAADRFGLDVDSVASLPAERDRNFLVHAGDRFVLKVANSAEDPRVVEMECAAIRHVADVDPGLPVPRIHGETVSVRAADGRTHLVRLISAMPGVPADRERQPEAFAEVFGAACARMSRALRGFTHPSAARDLDWDPRDVARLRPALTHVTEKDLATALLDRLTGLRAATLALPAAVQHGDLNLGNVLVDDGAISGVIDFGDLHHTARVADLAIGLAALMRQAADPWAAAAGFLDGYQRLTPLEPEEVDVLGDLVLARTLAGVLISARQVARHPGNRAYLTISDEVNRRLLGRLSEKPAALTARFHRLCGTGRVRPVAQPDAALAARRQNALGDTALAPLFYRTPVQVTRAAGPWVYAADGRRYLDAYNNVPVVGHAHPAVVQAISRQAAVLNINSRYLHPHAVELAERLVATMPAGLDTVVFANSGSEVNDLAWRMASVFTGNTGVIVTDLAYHGVSVATAAMSTNTYPPNARPAHVAVFPPPRPEPDGRRPGGADARAAVEAALSDLHRAGHDVALLAVDTVFSAGGIVEPDPAYMRGLLAATNEAGGLMLADEVQAGFGRGGGHLWRFRDFGLEPDIVTLGKPMGNGHPVAALITRREIADRFAAVDEYFSTFGGNPVSCAAALAVLDVLEENSLVARAGQAGAALRAALRDLAGVVDVRGPGLMIGVETVLPARDLAERLRAAGVLVGTTGPGGATLKVRPPLVWTGEHVATFLAAFETAQA